MSYTNKKCLEYWIAVEFKLRGRKKDDSHESHYRHAVRMIRKLKRR